MKTEVDEDEDTRRKRQTQSGVEQSGSSLSADDYPRVTKTELDTYLPCDSLTPEPMKDVAVDVAVSAAPGPVVKPP